VNFVAVCDKICGYKKIIAIIVRYMLCNFHLLDNNSINEIPSIENLE